LGSVGDGWFIESILIKSYRNNLFTANGGTERASIAVVDGGDIWHKLTFDYELE
jgi:hypothetical protein